MATIKIDRGTSYAIGVVYTVNGVPTDITGSTVRFTMKDAEYDTDSDDSDATLKYDITNHSDPIAGESQIEFAPADTAELTPGTYYYDVKIELASGIIRKISEGKIKLDGSPTNRLS